MTMRVVEQMQVDLAVVEITDECRVELKLLRRRTDFSSRQAVALADALMRAASQAETYLEEQVRELQERMQVSGSEEGVL